MELDAIKKQILEDVDPRLREEKRREIRRAKIMTSIQFLALIVVLLLVFYILMGVSTVNGDSMYPSLHDGNKVLYLRNSARYEAGDVVVLHRPNGEEYVKRIVAVAGDTVNIQSGKLYVNGEERAFEDSVGETRWTEGDVTYPLQVQKAQVFVLGDNREVSKDSRAFGAIDTDSIAGRIICYFGSQR